MDALAVLLGLALVLYFLIGPGLGIAAFLSFRRQERGLQALSARVDAAMHEVSALRREVRDRTGPIEAAPVATAGSVPAVPAVAQTELAAASVEPEPAALEEAEAQQAQTAAPASQAMPELVPPVAPSPETFEQKLTSRWILWLGAFALALAGAFLVKYSIDEGLLRPATRVVMGFLAGCALMAGGEWLRERPTHRAIAAIRPDYVPPALTAGGVSIAFASAYAAFELYDLIGPLAAFLILGALSAGAILLALLQGPLIALLGIVGGFVTPLLVSTDNPSVLGLFTYITFIDAASLWIVRYTGARWLGLCALAGAAAWPLLWFAGPWHPGDAAVLGVYVLAFAALAVLVPSPELLARDTPEWRRPLTIGSPEAFAALAALCVCGLAFVLLRMDMYGWASLFTLAVLVCLSLLLGYRAVVFDGLPALTAVLTLAAFASWHIPQLAAGGSPRPVPPQVEALPQAHAVVPFVPPEPRLFLSMAAAFALLFGFGGFAALWRAPRPVLWAAVSAGTPVLLFTIAYWRVEDFGVNLSWCLVALVLAGANVAAASRCAPSRHTTPFAIALAFYAAAASAALALGAAMALQQAWLSVAFSIEVAALAWIGFRLDLQALRPIAAIVAGVVLVRLVTNPSLVDYPLGGILLLNWTLYGYGVPAIAFLLAARWFRRSADDWVVAMLEAGALAFAVLLVSLELHNLVAGSLRMPRTGLLEPSLQTITWLGFAIGLTVGGSWSVRPVAIWGARLLAAAAVLQIVVVQVLIENPLWSGEPVGRVLVFDLLLIAYGVPALLLLVYGRLALRGGWPAWGCLLLSLVLLFIEVSLEVRHGFHGPVLSLRPTSGAEWYSYSAAWLGFAGLLLVLGIRSGSVGLRYGSLAVLLVTVGKVFLSDMSALTGLYRVASFFGLGLCLIGVGYLYQRFVFPIAAPRRGRSARGA